MHVECMGQCVVVAAGIIILCMIGGMAAGVVIHEVGHYAACRHLGYESGGITIILHKSSHMCIYDRSIESTVFYEDMHVVRAAGGAVAVAVFGVAVAVFLLVQTRLRPGCGCICRRVRLFLLSGLVSQIINLVMEAGLAATWYNDYTRAVGVLLGVVIVLLLERHQFPKSHLSH